MAVPAPWLAYPWMRPRRPATQALGQERGPGRGSVGDGTGTRRRVERAIGCDETVPDMSDGPPVRRDVTARRPRVIKLAASPSAILTFAWVLS
jgi:hypothetical protein